MPDVLKRVPAERERWQSRALVWVVGTLLAVAAVAPVVVDFHGWRGLRVVALPFLLSAMFALLVWALRAATGAAAVMGFFVCFILAGRPVVSSAVSGRIVFHPAIAALVAVFVLTYVATRFGRARKAARGLAEARKGLRAASQIVANLGVAALAAAVGSYAGCIAALAETAADTVSSEIGQAVGGPAWLITSWRRVSPGTDGGVSLVGTVAGVLAALVIVGFGGLHHALWPEGLVVFVAACAGLVFDSLLGATVERRGWVGNDWVNFASTLFAAAVAGVLGRW
ncbi:hypothetical protein GCM10011507_10640 [Edaphobacter acidisoli]|uniref:DUF92 domain-containing protein n=2 Tax=Edaphobacter acidisoli TaxID=2040573 RepID=A0A916W259_9BACT|nr:hypothetical protein GCM10011507_10640 [Edaphobacter acidisoli]